MQRAKKKLHVDTFPFLAVLLCAMGSLILLLMVMDRRAKAVAKHKVAQELEARQEERNSKHSASLAQVIASRQAEWEKQRDKLHETLVAQENELRSQLSGMAREVDGASKKLEEKQSEFVTLQQKLAQEYQRLLQERQDLTQKKTVAFNSEDKKEAVVKSQMQRLTLELLQLEKALIDLKELKSRPSDAFSLVPYRGKHGDNRKPVYVECFADGMVMHPNRTVVGRGGLTVEQFRQEIQNRAGVLEREKPREPRSRTPAPTNPNAYVLFLVRPEGIHTYYLAQTALRGYAIDYGYELVESNWVFDFANEDSATQQPWHNDGLGAGKSRPLFTTGPGSVGFPGLSGPPGSGNGSGPFASGPPGSGYGYGPPGSGPPGIAGSGLTGPPGSRYSGPGTSTSGLFGPPGSTLTRPGIPGGSAVGGQLPGGPYGGPPGSGPGGPGGPGNGGQFPGGAYAGPTGSGPGGQGAPGNGGQIPGSPFAGTPGSGGPGTSGTGTPGNGGQPPGSSFGGPPGTGIASLGSPVSGFPGAGGSGTGIPGAGSPNPNGGTAGTRGSGLASLGAPNSGSFGPSGSGTGIPVVSSPAPNGGAPGSGLPGSGFPGTGSSGPGGQGAGLPQVAYGPGSSTAGLPPGSIAIDPASPNFQGNVPSRTGTDTTGQFANGNQGQGTPGQNGTPGASGKSGYSSWSPGSVSSLGMTGSPGSSAQPGMTQNALFPSTPAKPGDPTQAPQGPSGPGGFGVPSVGSPVAGGQGNPSSGPIDPLRAPGQYAGNSGSGDGTGSPSIGAYGSSGGGGSGGSEGSSGGDGMPSSPTNIGSSPPASASGGGSPGKTAPGAAMPEDVVQGPGGGILSGSMGGSGSPSKNAKPGPAPLGRMIGNHDYFITLECLADGVVIYPRNELYPMNPVANQKNVEQALIRAIQQMIARRQASVRPGEPDYRPMIYLQVEQEGLRTYYWIYPALQELRIPMYRENLEN